jgi:hypothetical protein
VSYLNQRDKVIASAMALTIVGLMGALCALVIMGAKQAPLSLSPAFNLPPLGGLGALLVGSSSLALVRRLLRG